MVTDQQYQELLKRISALENQLNALSRSLSEDRMKTHSLNRPGNTVTMKKRDIAYYSFDGVTYNKRDLVRVCVKRYILDHDVRNSRQLYEIFPDFIQGPLGVFRSVTEAEKYSNAIVRYFFSDPDVLSLEDGNFVVSKDWTARNISAFLCVMENAGYNIKRLN